MLTPSGRTIHYISSGSAGKPKDGDPRACWVEVAVAASVRAGEPDVSTVVHRVAYDVETVVREMCEAGLPERLGQALRSA
jgi:hypothetical protein